MNKNLGPRILKLRAEGKTYNQIAKLTGANKSTISYHCGEGQKEKFRQREIKRRSKHPFLHKMESFTGREKPNINYKQIIKSKSRTLLSAKLNNFTSKGEGKMHNLTLEDVINKLGDNPTCYLTGQKIDINNTRSYHFDHIIPVSRGGNNSLDNLGICTREANLAKRDMTQEEFIKFCKIVADYNK